MACLFLTSYTAMTFAQNSNAAVSQQGSAEQAAIPMYMGTAVVVVNLGFIGWVLWQLVGLIHWRELFQRSQGGVQAGAGLSVRCLQWHCSDSQASAAGRQASPAGAAQCRPERCGEEACRTG